MLRFGLPVKADITDSDDTRYDLSALVVCNKDGSPRGGVTSFDDYSAGWIHSTASMAVHVHRFQGWAERDGGVILLSNDGAENVELDPAPSSNSRIDLIYAVQHDSSSTVTSPDSDNDAVLGVVKGTAAPIPVKPALPEGALEVGTVEVPSTATTTQSSGVVITPTATFTAAAGGVVPFPTKSDLDGWTTAADGQTAVVRSDNCEYVWDGSRWDFAVPKIATGKGTNTAAGTSQVNFPSGFFTQTPHLGARLVDATNGVVSVPWVGNVTTSGFVTRAYTLAGAVIGGNMEWTAVQAHPWSADS